MDLPDSARTTWLTGLSAEDADLRPWLARVLDGGAVLPDAFNAPRVGAAFAAGDTVGPYRLAALVGEGGMGQVWRAQRLDDGPRRDVALKLPHAELLGGPFRARFARERDVLAALSHPHIAQIYDAGLSDDGHPYLALELVDGQPITVACRANRAGLRRRITLICQVLDALMFAHRRLIVHRDIKPSNVLVTPEGDAKLLDFGIAKLLHPDGSEAFPLTAPAGRMATPGYAAPEQLSDGVITVATDIFAVGVLLFELCTGRRPFVQVPRMFDAPPAPLASAGADAVASGAPEGAGLGKLLRGDLDAVMACALALDPAERYGSAEAFARDLRAYLAGQAVSARRIGWVTRTCKFARRNKAGMGLAAIAVLALVLGTAGIAWQARRAEQQAARANAIKDYLIALFDRTDPGGGNPIATMTAKQVLDAGADRADAAFAKQPETEIELLDALGGIYENIPDPARALQVRKRRLELTRALYGLADPRVVDESIELALALSLGQDDTRAAAILEDIRTPILLHFGPASVRRAEWLLAHAYTVCAQRHGAALAEADDQGAIDILLRYFPGDAEIPHALEHLATNQIEREEFSAAIANYARMHQVAVAAHQADAIEPLAAGNDMAFALEGAGQTAAAAAAYQAVQDQAERLFGKGSPFYRFALFHHADLLHMRGERARADELFAEAETIMAQPSLASFPSRKTFNRVYGGALLREGRAADAIPRLQDALAGSRMKAPYVTRLYQDEQSLGEAYAAVGRGGEARPLLRDARAGWIDENGPASRHALAARERWAHFLLDQGDIAGATTELRAILAAAGGTASAPAALAAADLAVLATKRGDMAQADALSARAVQWIDATTVEYDVRDRTDVWLARAPALAAVGKKAEARALADKAVSASEMSDAPESRRVARARDVRARLE
jgi:serine/threonine-protein kinase